MLQLILVQHRKDFYSSVFRIYVPSVKKILALKKYGHLNSFPARFAKDDPDTTGHVFYDSETKALSTLKLTNPFYVNLKYNV